MNNKRLSLDPLRLLALLRNPSASVSLRGVEDAPLGLIGAVLSIVGFFVWILSVQHQVEVAMSVWSGFLIGGLLSIGTAFKFLLIALLSLAALVAALSLIGNRYGLRQRAWVEIVTVQGASQLLFGIGFLVSALLAFLSLKLSFAFTAGLLLLSLLLLVIQALELHEVERKNNFIAITLAIAMYVVLFSICWLIIF